LATGDHIEFVETTNATLTTALNLTGNEIAQTITGNAGANILDGGIDNLTDTLIGGLGNDIYVINTVTDNITEAANGGSADRARASVSFTLATGDNIEFLETTNSALTTALNLTGNEIAQTITGNAAANILNGKGGNDILSGGVGADQFVFDTTLNGTTNVDTLKSFSSIDKIVLDNDVFTGLGTAFTASEFRVVKTGTSFGSVDASDNIIYFETTGQLYYDRDGSGTTYSAVLFAELPDATKVSLSSFVLIE
jgi:Ca2+-binding RTX toxin-like protein